MLPASNEHSPMQKIEKEEKNNQGRLKDSVTY